MEHKCAVPTEKLDRLRALLREMFQLDRGDLDFGLYRIMHMKSAEVTAFLNQDLLPQVKDKLKLTGDRERADLEKEIQDAVKGAEKLGVKPEDTPHVQELQAQLAEMRKDADAEADVYNHLANFFARYYTEGDFMSQRRYSSGGRSSYLIPYDGEEVKLHWANADQYYIKTTENYASYVFTVGAGEAVRRVRFEIAAADNEKDNVKEAAGKQRRFVLAKGSSAVVVEGDDLVVRFSHRPLTEGEKQKYGSGNGSRQQSRINEAAVERILNADAVAADWRALLTAPAPTEANGERTLLAKHIERYTAKNSFDYFIHKDLGGFLRRELDLYLNTEVLNLDDLEQGDAARLDRALARVRTIRHVGGKIIDFLAQLEDFQKQLWLKKKFVLETNWCVTLDQVAAALYPEIAGNAAQCEEWVELFAVDEIAGDSEKGGVAWNNPPSVEFLKANPYLVLDTRHFERGFVDKLLAALSDAGPLDEQLDGLLVRGENFQVLNTISKRYEEKVKSIYIDPPYNTDSSSIIYRNDYKDSSWMSLMENRLALAKAFLMRSGILCCAIDDEEMNRLTYLMKNQFDRELGIVSVRSNPAGRKSKGKFSPAHEYALFYGREEAVPGVLEKTTRQLNQYPLSDESGRFIWTNLIRSGSNDKREDRPKMFYPIYVKEDDTIRIPKMEWNEENREYLILEKPKSNETAIWPIKEQSGRQVEKNWHRGWKHVISNLSEYRVRRRKNESINIDFKARIDMEAAPKTWWDHSKYSSANGTKALRDLLPENSFDFPKSVELVKDCLLASGVDVDADSILDYFAGSGTTGHAVINLNREDGGKRKYILVEMGDYFDTVLVPRLKKITYSPDWKDGKPVSRKGGTQFFKTIRLESYEDTLDSLTLTPPAGGLLAENTELAEDYQLRYALGVETSGSACLLGQDFTNPFAYNLSVVRDGVRRAISVDLPETFNYLIGLRVESRRRIDDVLAITGTDPEGRKCLILWRNTDKTDYSALDTWFARNREQFAKSLNVIYVNGDHTLNAMKQTGEIWIAETIEPVFRERMFGKQP